MKKSNSIESTLKENRLFEASKDFKKKSFVHSLSDFKKDYQKSIEDPEGFWAEQAEKFEWQRKWNKTLEWNLPYAKWFVGGKTNISVNCLDRHLTKHSNKNAIIFESEAGDVQKLTYSELHRRVCQFANLLKSKGIKKGDQVAIYMPLIPEAVVSMLACARIGAIHSVVFAGFSSQALSDRMNDGSAKAVITADGGFRRGKVVELKSAVDEALKTCSSPQSVFVYQWAGNSVSMKAGRDIWVHEAIASQPNTHEAEQIESEDPLFVLYTSGSTGKPKGIVHSTAGYMLYTATTTQAVFDLKPEDVYWCSADIGWITGHSYVTYGPLLNAATVFLYEGAPDFPECDRFWSLIERHSISIFYTAPTAIRAFMKWGESWVDKHDLSSLRLLGSVGEPINPEAWVWYYKKIGGERCPIVDTWWQTETGGIMITTLPGIHGMKPGSAGVPMLGIDAAIMNSEGKECGPNEGGFLVIKQPWPSMIRGVFGDEDRFKKTYWDEIPGVYFAGDGARKDEDGYFWIMGRVDDVVNVSGHRLGTAEIESALVAHPSVCEAAVVGVPDEIKGESIVAFVSLEPAFEASDALKKELQGQVAKEIGAIARPSRIQFSDALPKTRSGKIMRRLLRSIASGNESQQDMSTLEDQSILDQLRKGAGEE